MAAAAYRSGSTLRDRRYGTTHRYTGRRGIVHCEIMAPAAAPAWAGDREALWNEVEAAEARKDAQLARLVEIGLPVELSGEERVALVRDYVAREFVAAGMVADFSLRGDDHNPHTHILLTLRVLGATGFGPKERRWNGRSVLVEWRAAWSACANLHLARAGHAVRIDHRTLEAQQIELTPGRRLGIARERQAAQTLPDHLADRLAERQCIARRNGDTIIEDPTVALRALTHQRPVFSRSQLERFLESRTADRLQLDRALGAVLACGDCVALDPAAGTPARFTSRDILEAEASLMRRALSMSSRRGRDADPQRHLAVAARCDLTDGPRRVFEYLANDGDAKAIAVDDAAKRAVLTASRLAWEQDGLTPSGAALSDSAAAKLEAASGIPAHSIGKCEQAWQQGHGLGRHSVLVIDGCHLIGLRQLERLVSVADHARARVVMVADCDSFMAMKSRPAFDAVWRRIGCDARGHPP